MVVQGKMPLSKVFLYQRLKSLQELLKEKNLPAILVSNYSNRYYLTGWFGDIESGYLLITQQKAFIVTDNRYTEEVAQKVPHFELVEIQPYDKEFWSNFFKKTKIKKVAFESSDLSVASLKKFRKQSKAVWIGREDLIEGLRSQKDEEEIKLVKKAISIADKCFDFVLKNIQLGMSEKQLAWKMELFMRELESSKNAWDSFIVASGPNSSMVHYPAGERKFKNGDQILLDYGCYYEGYCCDISRVIFLGTPSQNQAEIYNLVLEAQAKGFEQVKVGKAVKNVDLAARNFLREKTPYYFQHAVGHGVGLEVHELPKVNEKTKEKFRENQVITVEPGIYIPRWGGVRIEDMVLVTKTQGEILTKAPREIEKVII